MGVFLNGGTKMTNNEKALDILVSQTHKFIKDFCKKLDFDRTYIGIVSSVKSGECVVKYNGTDIHVKTSETDICKIGDKVKLCIPCGNARKAFIINNSSSSGYSGDAVESSVVSYIDDTGTIKSTDVKGALDEIISMIIELKNSIGASEIDDAEVDELFDQIINE